MPNDMVVRFPGGKRVDAEYKQFRIATDQAIHHGGDGSAPAPFDLFLASIATCAGIYVLSFAEKRGIDMRDASLIMRTERKPEGGLIERIFLEIRLPAGFPEKYRSAVIRAANACSVKAHFENPPRFEVDVKIPG
jgi:ribosomal protein S12 methylthiotransferase accessory factor